MQGCKREVDSVVVRGEVVPLERLVLWCGRVESNRQAPALRSRVARYVRTLAPEYAERIAGRGLALVGGAL